MTAFSRPYSKRNRLHKSVGEFVNDLNSRDQSKFDHLREWQGIKGDLTFESRDGQQDDYDGCDFLIHHADGSLRAQDKLRQVNTSSHNPRSGKDVGVEAMRMYGWGKSENFKFVLDYGRDICKIPGESIQVQTGAGDQLRVANRNYERDYLQSDLYVVHPSDSPVICCESKRLKSIASSLVRQIPQKVWEGGDVYQIIREAFRGKRSYHLEQCLDDIPTGVQLICLRDVDRKPFSLNGMEAGMALVAKVIVYIPPKLLTHIKLKVDRNMLRNIYHSKWFPRIFYKKYDGGQESGVTGYMLVEWKPVFSIGLLHFKKGSREAFHNHAFNAITWWLQGEVTEVQLSVKERLLAITEAEGDEKIALTRSSPHRDTWAITFRGPWVDTWKEWRKEEGEVTLTHGRKVVKV